MILNILLYSMLGVLLNALGINVLDKPLEFSSLLALILVIDFVAYNRGLKTNDFSRK